MISPWCSQLDPRYLQFDKWINLSSRIDFSSLVSVQVSKQSLAKFEWNEHLVSLRSNEKRSSLTISLIESGVKVVQEKDSSSEMFDVKLNLFDLHWHQIAFRWAAPASRMYFPIYFASNKNNFPTPQFPKRWSNNLLHRLQLGQLVCDGERFIWSASTHPLRYKLQIKRVNWMEAIKSRFGKSRTRSMLKWTDSDLW